MVYTERWATHFCHELFKCRQLIKSRPRNVKDIITHQMLYADFPNNDFC